MPNHVEEEESSSVADVEDGYSAWTSIFGESSGIPTHLREGEKPRFSTFINERWLDGIECLVCIHEFFPEQHITTLPCMHFFHSSCIARWLRQAGTCPTCRYRL